MVKKVIRALLFVFAIAMGGLLGYYLLVGYELSKLCFFGAACIVLGYVFHAIDKKLEEKK